MKTIKDLAEHSRGRNEHASADWAEVALDDVEKLVWSEGVFGQSHAVVA